MKKDHYAKFTIEVTDRRLRPITKSVNLDNPNEITDIQQPNKMNGTYG